MLTIGVVGRRTGADWLLPLNFACRMTATSESCRWRISRRATGPPWNLPLAGRFECVTTLRARSCPMPEANGCIRKRRTGTTDLQQPVASAYRAAAMQRVGHSRPQRELTVSATFRSSRRQRDRDADDRSQGSAAVARRMCVARWFPERQLNRYRGHWASKTNRMSAAHGAGLTHPTDRRRRRFSDRLTGVPCHRPFVALSRNQNSVRTVIRDCSPATSAKTEPSGRSETDWRYGDDPLRSVVLG